LKVTYTEEAVAHVDARSSSGVSVGASSSTGFDDVPARRKFAELRRNVDCARSTDVHGDRRT